MRPGGRGSSLCLVTIKHLHLRGVVRDLAPENQAARAARLDDAPLSADPHDTARQVLLAQSLARGDFRRVMPGIELAIGDVAGKAEGWFGRCLGHLLAFFPRRAV